MALAIRKNHVSLLLETMGYTEDYISRAMAVHKKTKLGTDYDLSLLVEIISRLKAKDEQKKRRQLRVPFEAHFQSAKQALKLKINDIVDYRYENGRVVLCKILQRNMVYYNKHYVVLLHPLSEPLSTTKHNRYCDLNKEFYKLSAPRSVSLRKLTNKHHPLYNLQCNDYFDINPMYKRGHEGWKSGRIIKIDPKSSQVKVIYYHSKKRSNYSYWVHLENIMEAAPFKTKSHPFCEITVSDHSEDEEMYINHDVPSTPTPKGSDITADSSTRSITRSLTAPCYSMDLVYSDFDIVTGGQLIGDQLIEEKTDCDDILEQLYKFGYNSKDVKKARDNVADPDDINSIVQYLTALDMELIIETAAINEPLPKSPEHGDNDNKINKEKDQFQIMSDTMRILIFVLI